MLPRNLSDDLCSLHPHVRRPALVCQVSVNEDGSLADDAVFFAAWLNPKPSWLMTMFPICWKGWLTA